MLTHRFECEHRGSVHCSRGDGTTRRKRCAYCGGAIRVYEGRWGVFEWSGDGRYPAGAALATFARRAAAEREADSIEAVVRWIPA